MSDSISIGWYGPSNDYWGWILGHFRDVTLLTDRNVEDWLALQSQTSNHASQASALLLAIDSRVEPEIDRALGQKRRKAVAHRFRQNVGRSEHDAEQRHEDDENNPPAGDLKHVS